jgi:hypothetical protein
MILNDRPFVRRKPVLLGQHGGVLLVNLPDIVKKGGATYMVDLALAESDGASDDRGVMLNAPRMTRSVRVSSLQRLDHQLKEFLIRLLEFDVRPLDLAK